MPGPARSGLSVFAVDQPRVARFYETVLGMSRVHESRDVVVLESPDIQLLVHRIPADRAANITISSPPQPRGSALKFFFTVPQITTARAAAREAGGDVLFEQWQGPGFIVCDAYDPEGNIFHIRETMAQPTTTPDLSRQAAPDPVNSDVGRPKKS